MKLLNSVRAFAPAIPPKYKDKIIFVATCGVDLKYAELAGHAVKLTIEKIEEEGIDIRAIVMIMTRDGKAVLQADASFGSNSIICIFQIDLWEKYKISDRIITAAFIEEMVHSFWNTDDEIVAKNKVLEILRQEESALTMQALFGEMYNYDKDGNLIDDEYLHN